MRRLDELIAAFTLLTRLPVAKLIGQRAWPAEAASVWAYPVVGAMVGGVGGLVFWTGGRAGMTPGLAAVLALAATMALTGALHEDGLADTADGFGGGVTAARKLEIMRDSRIGSYGALALIVAFAIRATALASLPGAAGAAALVAAGCLGRGAILVVLTLLRPAREDGSAWSLQQARFWPMLSGLVVAVVSSALLRAASLGVIGVVASTAFLAHAARRQVGGYTGDILGAAEVLAECVVLCIAATA